MIIRTYSEGAQEILDWTKQTLADALEFAERDLEAVAQARARQHAVNLRNGTCTLGHPITGPIPRHEHNGQPCGYCLSLRESK